MDVRRRRSEPQPAEGAEGPDHGSQEGAVSKAREGDGRLKAIEDATNAARTGEAKEDAQTGARLKDFPKGEAKEDAQLGVRAAARTGEATEDAQTGARTKDFPGEATEAAQKGVDEASRTTEAPRTGGSVVPNGGEGVGGGETPGRSFFTPTARGGKVTETPKELASSHGTKGEASVLWAAVHPRASGEDGCAASPSTAPGHSTSQKRM